MVEVPVQAYGGRESVKENGVVFQSVLLEQLKSARKIIDDYDPDRIVVFGGDCLVSQAPLAYLNERHGGELGVLWIDAHPDVSRPDFFQHEHAMVLGNLLGEGDPVFAKEVRVPLKPNRVMFAGLGETLELETEIIERLGIARADSSALSQNSEPVFDWIRGNDIRKLAVHLDLDVLDPTCFRSLYFSDPAAAPNAFDEVTQGKMNFEQLVRLLSDVSKVTQVFALCIAEHLPWDARNLKNLLEQLPILSEKVQIRKY